MSFAEQAVRLYAWHAQGLDVKVWREYEDFVEELSQRFPHEREGIKKFYGECWAVFNSLNSLELKSLEEPRYLLGGDLSCTFYSHLSYACKMTTTVWATKQCPGPLGSWCSCKRDHLTMLVTCSIIP